jgi:hypothetical protein
MLLTIVFLLLSIKTKAPGEESIRPFYYAGMLLLLAGTVYFLPAILSSLRRLGHEARIVLTWFAVIYGYMFLQTFDMPMRALKDFALGGMVDWSCFALLLAYSHRCSLSGADATRSFATALLSFAVICSLVAWFSYFDWISISIAGNDLGHNPVWSTRIHGWLGEPTYLGTAAGIGVVMALYLLGAGANSPLRRFSLYAALILLGCTLYGAGSRNGLMSAAAGVLMMVLFWRGRRWAILMGAMTALVGGLLVMMAVMNIAGPYLDVINHVAERLPNSLSASAVHLEEAFRINDPAGAIERLRIFADVVEIYSQNNLLERLVGAGYGFTRLVYGSALNDYLESLVDFGVIYVVIVVGYFLYVQRLLFRMMKGSEHKTFHDAVLGTALLAFSLIFAMNLSSLFVEFFHLANFAPILVTSLVVVNYRSAEVEHPALKLTAAHELA